MKAKKLLALLLTMVMVLSLAACVQNGDPTEATDPEGTGVYTYNTYLTLSPSNWNELTYKDSNDTNIMSYIGSSFFGFDFAYDENGEIISGGYQVTYEAATKLEDVTAAYAEAWGLPADGKGYAYKITLRDDLTWENGDPIKAEDFVYTMQEQLNPLFQNYRADSFYVGSTIIVNAENYVKQGSYAYSYMVPNYADEEYITEFSTNDAGAYFVDGKGDVWINLKSGGNWGKNGLAAYWNAYGETVFVGMADAWAAISAAADENGYVAMNAEFEATVSDMIAVLHGYANAEAYAADAGNYAYLEWQEFCYYGADKPAMDFSEVGIFVGDTEYELVVVLQKPLDLLNEDGTLTYKAAYNFASLPLVHKATYEANKVAPSEGTTLWTSTYNSSAETTMSWGPFTLESFQAGKQHVLVRNENWYAYSLAENEGLYQTDRIVCDIVENWQSAWTLFQAGQIDGIGIDVSIADDYKGSDRAYFTPDDYVGSLQLQSSYDSLVANQEQEENINKTILANVKFRKALSLSINRAEFATQCTTSSKQGFGLYNSMHYYDVANAGVFRDTDEAKQVLCDVYGVDVSKYDSLDAAYESITGYNIDLAKTLIIEAYNEALTAGEIDADDVVKLTFGTGKIAEAVTRQFNYLADAFKAATVGTPLEGRIELELKDFGDAWADDFRAGDYEICMGGWSGAAWDPGYFLLAYLSPSYMYSAAWDTSSVMMEFTMKGVGENGEDITDTMSLMDWYNCLNGASGAKYNWSSGALEESQRLQLIAALEKEVLSVYYTIPMYNYFGASMLSYQIDYITYEYNTFMSYGGLKYMTYNFDDAQWTAEVAKVDGQLNYK